MAEQLITSRVHTEIVNLFKINVNADYAFGEYIALKTFFEQLSEIQREIVAGNKIKLPTGQYADPNTTGGLLGIQIFMEAIDSQRTAMTGLSKLGLNVEKQVWKNI